VFIDAGLGNRVAEYGGKPERTPKGEVLCIAVRRLFGARATISEGSFPAKTLNLGNVFRREAVSPLFLNHSELGCHNFQHGYDYRYAQFCRWDRWYRHQPAEERRAPARSTTMRSTRRAWIKPEIPRRARAPSFTITGILLFLDDDSWHTPCSSGFDLGEDTEITLYEFNDVSRRVDHEDRPDAEVERIIG
jgi:hypothetical protein